MLIVGETGFEPATLRSQSECATGLRYSPIKNNREFNPVIFNSSKESKYKSIPTGKQ
jgi:hypothetical protein